MANIRTLQDITGSNDRDDDITESFTGGHRSALAVENPNESGSLFRNAPFAIMREGPPGTDVPVVTMYQNGFIVNGGEFRNLEDPQNAKFLRALKSGRLPPELGTDSQQGKEIALIDKSNETYVAPKKGLSLFGGGGFRLGAIGSLFGSSAAAASNDAPLASTSDLPVDGSRANVKVDTGRPTTTLQLRAHTGSTVRQTFNTDASLSEVRRFVESVAPVAGGFRLLRGFPPSEIKLDSTTTLEEAGLLGETLLQKPL